MRRLHNSFSASAQTDSDRHPVDLPAQRARTIAVVSGKGGVGKTSIAVNTAFGLARFGKSVTLVDLDVGLGNADLAMGVDAPLNLSHVLSGRCEIDDAVVDVPGGIRLVAGGSGVRGQSDMSREARVFLADQVHRLRLGRNFNIYDCGAGIGENVLGFAALAETIWVVSNPDPASLTDAYTMIKVLLKNRYHGSIEFIVNKVESRLEADTVYQRAAEVTQTFLNFNLAYGGYVLQDTRLESAIREQRPVVLAYPRSPSSMCLIALAARLIRSPAGKSPGGVLARFAGLFA